jgi:hypothetical protein
VQTYEVTEILKILPIHIQIAAMDWLFSSQFMFILLLQVNDNTLK